MENIARFLAAFGGMCGLLLYVAVTPKNAGGSPTGKVADREGCSLLGAPAGEP